MSKLTSDGNGFLKGERNDPALANIWGGMRDDLSAIRKALEAGAAYSAPAMRAAPRSGARSSAVALPSGSASGAGVSASAAAIAMAQVVKPVLKKEVERVRDTSGRFQKKDGSGKNKDEQERDEKEATFRSAIWSRTKSLASGASDAEDVDSTIKAVNEVARPIARGYEILKGGDDQERSDKKHERWYRRIFNWIKKDGEDGKKNQKATNKLLKSIDGKPLGGAGARGGFLGNVVQGLGGGMGAGLMGMGAGLMKGGAAALRRIPLLGGLFAAAEGAWGLWSSESSDMSRGEKDRASGKALGGAAGSLGGMLGGAKLGAMLGTFAGPIGTAIGGLVGGAAGLFFGDKAGQVIGDTVGGWVAQLREVDIGGMFKDAITSFKTTISETFTSIKTAWDSGLANLSSMWEGFTGAAKDKAKKAHAWIKDTTGIDVSEKLNQAGEAIVSAAKTGKEAVQRGAAVTAEAVKNSTIGKGVAAVGKGIKETYTSMQARNALLNEMSDRGITDPKERAMIMAQLDHESAGFKSMQESFSYRSADRVMAVSQTAKRKGKGEVEAAMAKGPEALAELMYGGRKDLGNINPGDGFAFRGRGQTMLTGRANYRAAGQALGLDLENNPDLVADPTVGAKVAMWYWNSRKVGDAARAGDVEAVTQKINGGQNGIDDRKALYSHYLGTQVATASASVPVASAVPSAPPVPTPSPAPKVPVQVASAGAGRGFVNPAAAEPGQDLQDRRLAHVATGGYSA